MGPVSALGVLELSNASRAPKAFSFWVPLLLEMDPESELELGVLGVGLPSHTTVVGVWVTVTVV